MVLEESIWRYAVKASNFGPFLARFVASLGKKCTKNEQN
jgi:hypothetical protein